MRVELGKLPSSDFFKPRKVGCSDQGKRGVCEGGETA